MRVVAAVVALMLLAGCDAGQTGTPSAQDSTQAVAPEGMGAFDYRYAYRLPSDRLKAVLQSNADACDKLGPTRCQIDGIRYSVDDSNRTRAVLMLKIDPTIARAFGEATTKSVTGADGVLVNTAITGTASTTQARSIAVIDRLRDQLKNAQAVSSDSPDAAAAKARAERIQSALDTIAESEAKQGATLATAPMLLTYESSTALTGLGTADANFRNAGQTLENSVARLLIVLGSIGPWLLALLLIIVVLRWVVHGRGGVMPANGNGNGNGEHELHEQHDDRHDDKRNLIQRWFNRDDDEPRDDQGQQH